MGTCTLYIQPLSVLEKLIHFQTLDLTKFLTCSVDLSMDTISGTPYIEVIFSLPGIGISLVTHSVALSVLSRNSFTF
jgi:hypothetical protein